MSSSPAKPLPTDPADEQPSSAVFLPFPTTLLTHLSPPTTSASVPPLFPGISPAPSESDVSDRRYSDVSDLSLDSHSAHSDIHIHPSPTPKFPPHHKQNLPPTQNQLHFPTPSAIPSASSTLPSQPRSHLAHIPSSHKKSQPQTRIVHRRNDLLETAHTSRSVPTLPFTRPSPKSPSKSPANNNTHHSSHTSSTTPTPTNHPFAGAHRASVAGLANRIRPLDEDVRRPNRLRTVWRMLARRKDKDKDKDKDPHHHHHQQTNRRKRLQKNPNATRETSAASFASVTSSGIATTAAGVGGTVGPTSTRRSVPPSSDRDAAVARGNGRRPRSIAFAGPDRAREDSPSLANVAYNCSPQRERVSLADIKREPNSFIAAGYRGRRAFTAEGSSVSSSEDREDDGNGPESGSLGAISRRQLRAMQYK